MAAFISCSTGGGDDAAEKAAEQMADFFGPAQVDEFIRQAVKYCWMALPKDRRNLDELERQIRRLVDRALKDYREDRQEFGSGGGIGASTGGPGST